MDFLRFIGYFYACDGETLTQMLYDLNNGTGCWYAVIWPAADVLYIVRNFPREGLTQSSPDCIRSLDLRLRWMGRLNWITRRSGRRIGRIRGSGIGTA